MFKVEAYNSSNVKANMRLAACLLAIHTGKVDQGDYLDNGFGFDAIKTGTTLLVDPGHSSTISR